MGGDWLSQAIYFESEFIFLILGHLKVRDKIGMTSDIMA